MMLDLERTEQLELPVSHFMTKNPSSAFMTTSIAYGLSMLSQGGFRHIPIVDDDNFPVALISVKDIVDHIVGQLTSDLLALKCDVFGE
jgi:CBS domain-containing protein